MLQDTIKTLLSAHLIGLNLVLPWALDNRASLHFRGYYDLYKLTQNTCFNNKY